MRCPALLWLGAALLAAAVLGAAASAHRGRTQPPRTPATAPKTEPPTLVDLVSELLGVVAQLTLELRVPGGSRLVSVQTKKSGHKTTLQLSFPPEAHAIQVRASLTGSAVANDEGKKLKTGKPGAADAGNEKTTNQKLQGDSKNTNYTWPLPYLTHTRRGMLPTAPGLNTSSELTAVYEQEVKVSADSLGGQSELNALGSTSTRSAGQRVHVEAPYSRSLFGQMSEASKRYVGFGLTFFLRLLDAIRQLVSVIYSAFYGHSENLLMTRIAHGIADRVALMFSDDKED